MLPEGSQSLLGMLGIYQIFKAILVNQVNECDHGDNRITIVEPLAGTGVLNNQGEAWKYSRALLRPQFARDNISNLEMEERHLSDMWPVLDKEVGKDDGWTGVIDLQDIFPNLTLGTSVDFLLGHKVNLQSWQVDEKAHELREKYRLAAVWAYFKFLVGRKHWMVPSWQLRHHSEKSRDFFRPFVRETLERLDNKGDGDMKGQDAKTSGRFILLDELSKLTQDPVELEAEIIGVLSASRTPTTSLLSWAMYFLARNPGIFDKLRTAVISQFGTKPENITLKFLDSSSLNYLRMVSRETLRLVPTPVLSRSSLVDTTLPRGGGKDGLSPVFVPNGTDTRVAMLLMSHRSDIWGPDVEEFKPERWEDRTFGIEYSPFSAGRRKCLGQQFALAEAHYVLVRFLQRYDQIANMEPPGPIRYSQTIATRNGKGYEVKLHRA